jgi:hypothetical protein
MEWVWVPEPHAGRPGLVLHAHFVAILTGERNPTVVDAVREVLKHQLSTSCGHTRVKPYEDRSGSHYIAEYLAKGSRLYLSRGLRHAGELGLRRTATLSGQVAQRRPRSGEGRGVESPLDGGEERGQ